MQVILFPNAATGPRLELVKEQHSRPRPIGELAAEAVDRIERDRAAAMQREMEADKSVIALHRELSGLSDRAIFMARNLGRAEQIIAIFQAFAAKVANAVKPG